MCSSEELLPDIISYQYHQEMLAIAIPDPTNSIQVIEWETTAGAEVHSSQVGQCHSCIYIYMHANAVIKFARSPCLKAELGSEAKEKAAEETKVEEA